MFNVKVKFANIFHFISNKNIYWMNDSDVVKNLTFRGNFNRFKAIQYYLKNRHNMLLAIFVNETHVGNCGFYNISNNCSEFRIVFGEKKLWGKGLSKFMVKEALDIAKTNGISKVYLEVFEDNIPAVKLYESCGFNFIGRYIIGDRISKRYILSIQ